MIRGIPVLSVISCPHEMLVNMPVIKFQHQVCVWPCLKHPSDPTQEACAADVISPVWEQITHLSRNAPWDIYLCPWWTVLQKKADTSGNIHIPLISLVIFLPTSMDITWPAFALDSHAKAFKRNSCVVIALVYDIAFLLSGSNSQFV